MNQIQNLQKHRQKGDVETAQCLGIFATFINVVHCKLDVLSPLHINKVFDCCIFMAFKYYKFSYSQNLLLL